MASSRPTQEGWFLEKGVDHGLDSIFFSNRAFVNPAVHVPSGAQQQDTSHYACPRTPPRSLHSWGTYSPPPQRSGLNPRDPNPGDVSSAGAVPVKPPRPGYHAHTLPLPRRGLAVFRPWVHSFPQGYNTSNVDKPRMLRATITSSSSASSQGSRNQTLQIPKDQDLDEGQPRENHQDPSTQNQTSPQPVHPKTIPVLQSRDKTRRDSKTTETDNHSVSNSIKRQVDMTSQNVFGQPRLQASLREPLSPQQSHKSNLEEELRRLIILDTPDNSSGDPESNTSLRSPSIGNSLGSGTLDSSLACSPVSDCPELDNLSASDLSLIADWEPELLPQPDPAWGLEWSNLVNAAKACDMRRNINQLSHNKPHTHGSLDNTASCLSNHCPPHHRNLGREVSSDLSKRLHYLEALLRHLESNLEKERQDKMALLEEVTVLRDTNQRLWEESLAANEQLRKLTLLFNVAPGTLTQTDRK
ncbi:signal-induced proliferation-associated 1-like protein 3 [Hypomesus transpacificus]|uniref:signal-induced proliferation-associated 1-like protein 3 n=1 Tax=Hypomesus transpacificus TaxID=137520 RepID=UPI001F075ADA|nr:signal-induced proliferation-associated 1-like protein 3 [Hypomesus transpacificus]